MVDGVAVRAGEALHPIAAGSMIEHKKMGRSDRDSLVVRIGPRLVVRRCAAGDCDSPFTVRLDAGERPATGIIATIRERLRDSTFRAEAAVESVLADDFRIVDGVLRLNTGSADLRPLFLGQAERGLVAHACRYREPQCSPERGRGALCSISNAGCSLSIPGEGLYQISLFRRSTSDGQVFYETTHSAIALVFVATEVRLAKVRRELAEVDAALRTYLPPPLQKELLDTRRAVILAQHLGR